jgi:hypothetical protein
MSVLFGDKTTAWLDVWSLEHLVAGISASTIAYYAVKWLCSPQAVPAQMQQRLTFSVLLLMAYGWETIEHYLETGVTGIEAVTYWFHGVEFWGNRLITDPLLVLLGGYIAQRYPRSVIPARFFSLAWLVIHLFIFPHSMYLHDLLSNAR